MTTEQALSFLLQVTAHVQTTRETHAQILKALEVLKEAVEKGTPNAS